MLKQIHMRSKFFFGTSSRINIELPLRRTLQLLVILLSFGLTAEAQLMKPKPTFTKEDTLRGSLNENRDWWDVLRYEITVKPNFETKEIEGKVEVYCNVLRDGQVLQIDLQQPLIITKVETQGNFFSPQNRNINIPVVETHTVKQEGNVAYIFFKNKRTKGTKLRFTIFYNGKPREAVNAPWDGGWIWKKDKNNNPFVSVAVQGLGASAWYPCKDYQGDEPDNGASLTITVPDSLQAIANGKLIKKAKIKKGKLISFTWDVKNPINNYCIVPYIGKYTNFTDTLMGEKGKLDLNYWVLDYNVEKAKEQFKQVKPMLRAMEYWFGAYPFYEDGYKLVEAPHLGMEHQSAVAYGNQYKNGYLGMDRSGKSGWGLKWDFIIVHESGHEWFANNITTKDIADMWVHESFTTYSETLFTEYHWGKNAANEYNYGQRKNIGNKETIIGPYGVNKEGSGDMYDKGSNMLHSIRHSLNNDVLFREMLRGLNKTFYHQTVTTKQIEDYIINKLGFDYQPVFNQYLRTTQIPTLEYYFSEDRKQLNYRYTNCLQDFNLPIWITVNENPIQILPTTNWKKIEVVNEVSMEELSKLYYFNIKKVAP